MAAPPRSGNSDPSRLPRRSSAPSQPRLRGINSANSARRERPARGISQPSSALEPDEATVHSFRPKPKPLWLALLLRCQQASSIATLLLVAGVLTVYGWTVYIQQRWGQEYDRLEAFKKQERQLVSANELLKNQMAEQAENPTAGLLLPDPSNAIFLTPAPQRPEVKPKSAVPPAEPVPTRPLGY